ncbi:cytochrome P450 family protein [Actinokineospora sp. NPDC004072]
MLELHATDPRLLTDPFGVYGEAREAGPLARLVVPGMTALWVVTRYEEARAVLGDDRVELRPESFLRPPMPPEVEPYLHTMAEMDGPAHARLRRLVAPAFSARRAEALRPRVERVVDRLLTALPDPADLVADFARPLPMDVICELIGVPDVERWREHGAAVAAGAGAQFMAAIPAIIEGAKAAVARRRATPADDILTDLIRVHDGDRLTDTELVTLVWHLVLAGQTPTNLIANAVEALLTHPDQLAALRADPALMPGAVEELTRWCSPQLLTTPRYTREPVDVAGTTIPAGEPVTISIAAANHDPRAFSPTLDITRPPAHHLAYAHGPHYCLGAPLARIQTESALTALLTRYPNLAIAGEIPRTPDPGTWRMSALPVTLT